MKKIYISIFALLFGCVSTKYTPIDLSEELNYNKKEVEKLYSVDKEWWKKYNNKELNNLIDLAIKNNPSYIRAALNVNRELYRLSYIKTDLFPTLSGNLGATSGRNIYEGDSFSNTFTGELGIKYELDLYGKIRDSVNVQEFELKATLADRETARLTLVNSVVDLYYNIVYLNNSIAATENSLKNYKDILNIAQEKYKTGKVDSLEFLQAKQSVATAENNILSLKNQSREMEQSLRNILNLKPDDKLNIGNTNILNTKIIGVNLDVPMAVLAERPDLQASQYRLEKAFKNLKIEDKSWYPTVSLGGVIGSSASKARSTFEFPYILGNLSIDLPFLDWNRVKNNVKISEVDYQSSLVDYKESINTAVNEVAFYYIAYSNSGQMYKNSQKKYNDDTKITNYYKDRYTAGKIELKYWLDAINSENNSRIELIQRKYEYIKYENMVYKTMNGRYESKTE